MLSIEQIKEGMADRNITQVAARVGVTRVWLSAILSGRGKPSYDMLEKLSNYLQPDRTEKR